MGRGFFESLFDFSFSSFITVRLIKVIYGLFIAASAFLALLFVASAFSYSAFFGLFVLLIGAPVMFFFYLILARVYLELVVAIFRIAENTSILAGQGRSLSLSPQEQAGPPPPPPPAEEPSPPAEEPSPPPPPPPPLEEPPPPGPPEEPPPPPPPAGDGEGPPETEPAPPPPPDQVSKEGPGPPPAARTRRQTPLKPRRAPAPPPPEPPT